MSLLIFSHANSFPASTYGVLFELLRQRGFTVRAIEKFGHDPRYPVTNNWPHLTRQLIDFAKDEVARAGQPAFLVGHSFGGFVSLMAAAQHPELARGVLLLDSPILGGWRAQTLKAIKHTKLVGSVSPGAVSKKRRVSWPDEAAALAHFQSKKSFALWHPQVLKDYIAHCTHDQVVDLPHPHTRRVLSFDRDIETAIYNTLPHHLDALLRQHPLRVPVGFIGGIRSKEMRQVGMAMTSRLTQGRIALVDGSHLFPMERPEMTAAGIEMYAHDMLDSR